MNKITIEEIEKLSKLARIGLTKEEITLLESEMGNILDYVERLKDINVLGIEPTSQVSGLVNIFREDIVVKSELTREDLLKNAPEIENGFIKVKSVL